MLQSSSRGGGSSPWSGGVLPAGGVSAWSWGGLPGPGGGVCLVPGGFSGDPLPPVYRITDTCKNITLATTSLRPVITARQRKGVGGWISLVPGALGGGGSLSVCSGVGGYPEGWVCPRGNGYSPPPHPRTWDMGYGQADCTHPTGMLFRCSV